MMKKVSTSPLARLYSTRQNLKSSQRNHYDTLKITPHATQNEIKSAYYKLSLQYHPDKNKNDYAKQKFQDISDAYEVLGNHELRKNYDRHMLLRQQPISDNKQPKSQYRDNVYSGTTRIYNFDEWTQAHYGRQLHSRRVRRSIYEEHKKMENMQNYGKKGPQYLIEIVLLLLTMTLVTFYYRKNFDVPIDKTKKDIRESKARD